MAGTGGTGRRPGAADTQTCFCSATGQIRAMWAIPRPSNHYHQPLLSHLSYYKSIHKVTLITRFDSLTNPKGPPHPSSISVHTHSPAGYTEAQRPRPSLLNPVSISPGYPGMLGFKRTRKGKCAQRNKGQEGLATGARGPSQWPSQKAAAQVGRGCSMGTQNAERDAGFGSRRSKRQA